MQLRMMAGLVCAVTAAACADATAPIDGPQAAPQRAAFTRGDRGNDVNGLGSGGSLSIVASKPVTLPFSTIDCNGDLVTGTSTHYALAVAAQGHAGTFDLTGAFDAVSATGPGGIRYTGSNLVLSSAVLAPNLTVFFTDQDFDLRPMSRTLKDTYLDIVTAYVATPNGPVLSKVSVTTKCAGSSKKY